MMEFDYRTRPLRLRLATLYYYVQEELDGGRFRIGKRAGPATLTIRRVSAANLRAFVEQHPGLLLEAWNSESAMEGALRKFRNESDLLVRENLEGSRNAQAPRHLCPVFRFNASTLAAFCEALQVSEIAEAVSCVKSNTPASLPESSQEVVDNPKKFSVRIDELPRGVMGDPYQNEYGTDRWQRMINLLAKIWGGPSRPNLLRLSERERLTLCDGASFRAIEQQINKAVARHLYAWRPRLGELRWLPSFLFAAWQQGDITDALADRTVIQLAIEDRQKKISLLQVLEQLLSEMEGTKASVLPSAEDPLMELLWLTGLVSRQIDEEGAFTGKNSVVGDHALRCVIGRLRRDLGSPENPSSPVPGIDPVQMDEGPESLDGKVELDSPEEDVAGKNLKPTDLVNLAIKVDDSLEMFEDAVRSLSAELTPECRDEQLQAAAECFAGASKHLLTIRRRCVRLEADCDDAVKHIDHLKEERRENQKRADKEAAMRRVREMIEREGLTLEDLMVSSED